MISTTGAIRTTPLHKGAILTIILVSYFMILLDNSVIFTALPSLQADLQLSGTELAWVQDAYTLVFGGLLLLGARAGDILGRKPVFIFGLIVFSVASLLIAVSPAGWWLIASRAVQGIGAAVVAPSALSLITATFVLAGGLVIVMALVVPGAAALHRRTPLAPAPALVGAAHN